MSISNEFTSPLDQNIQNITTTSNNILTTSTPPVSCASGEVTQTVNIKDATAALDNQYRSNLTASAQYASNPPSTTSTLSAQKIVNTFSNQAPSVYVPAGYYNNTNGSIPVQTTPGQYATTPNFQVEGTSSGYPSFGGDDPLFNPNRARSHNDTDCNSALWSLLTIPCPTCNGGKKQQKDKVFFKFYTRF